MIRFRIISITLISALAPMQLAAQEPSDTTELEPVVVTGTRVPLPSTLVPARITVFTGEELRARGVEFLSDAIRTVAGAHLAQNGSFGAVTSLFLRGGESDYVQVLVDGVAVNDPGGSYNFANLTLDNIDRIEILNGPAGVLYGSDAISGVVQIFTKSGGNTVGAAPGGSALVRGGTFGTFDTEAEFSGGVGAGTYSVSLGRFSSDGAYTTDPSGAEFNNDYRNTVASGRFELVPDEVTEVGFTFRYSDSKFNFPTDGNGNFVDQNSFTQSKVTTLGLNLTRWIGDRVDVNLSLSSNSVDAAFDDQQDAEGDTLGFFEFRDVSDVRRQSADLRVNYRLSRYTVFTGGAEIEGQTVRSFNQSRSQFGSGSGALDASRENRAVYAQAVLNFHPVSVTSGLRVDDNERFGSFVTYRAGLTLSPIAGARFHGAIGTGFKEPTFIENFSTGFSVGNPDLDPEQSLSWEAGGEWSDPTGSVRTYATYFWQRFEDLIQFSFTTPNPGDPNFFNVAEAEASGVETGVEVRYRRFSFGGNLSLLSTEVTNAGFDADDPDATFAQGERLLRRPETTFSLAAGVRLPRRSSVHLTGNFIGERIDRDFSVFPAERVTLDSYFTLDAAAEIGLVDRPQARLKATLRVENLLDEEFLEIAGFPARGRVVMAGARVGF